MARFILEEEIFFTDRKLFKDNLEHPYDVKCFDGHAIGTAVECEDNISVPKTIRILYPLRGDIIANERKAEYVLSYRGLYDLTSKDITYGDIMICLGKIVNVKTRNSISRAWSEFDKIIAKQHINKYGTIYLDEYDCPMDIDEVEMLLLHSK